MTAVTDFFDITPRNWRSRLAVTVEVMRELSRYTDPDAMYHVFTRQMSELYPTSRQVSLSRRGLTHPQVRVTRFNLWKEAVNPFREPHRLPILSGGLLPELAYADEPRILDEPNIHPEDPAYEFFAGQGSLLSIPLYDGGTGLNTVVVSREEPKAFPRETVPELVWMCNLFNRAMQTLVLSDRLREAYDAADYELRTIADLQQSLLPAALPNVPGLEIAVHSRTADEAGGDYYDFFPLSNGRLGVLIADVSGHGTPAAVLMSITHSLAHAVPELQATPGRMLAHLNSHLGRRYTKTSGAFVTGFYAVFDPHAQTLTYASAGHLPPRIRRGYENRWRPLPAAHRLPLGVNPRDGVYPEQCVPFVSGDRVALYTDGIVEGTDNTGEPYGYDRLDAALARSGLKAQEAVHEVLADLDVFGTGMKLADDRTLVVVRSTESQTLNGSK